MEQEEIWKDIAGYEGYYQISNLGVVRSLDRTIIMNNGKLRKYTSRIVKPGTCTYGYSVIALCKDCKQTRPSLHRLLALHFVPNPHSKPQVNHINGIKKDNKLENLEWVTIGENIRHAASLGLMPKGERSVMFGKFGGDTPKARAVNKICPKNGNVIKMYRSMTEAAKDHNIVESSISAAANGRSKTAAGFKWEKVKKTNQ